MSEVWGDQDQLGEMFRQLKSHRSYVLPVLCSFWFGKCVEKANTGRENGPVMHNAWACSNMVMPGSNLSPAFSSVWVTALLWSQPVEKLSTESSPFVPWQLHHCTASGSCACLAGLNSSTLEKSKPQAQTSPHGERMRGPPSVSKMRVQWVSWCQVWMPWSLLRSFFVHGCRESVGWRS